MIRVEAKLANWPECWDTPAVRLASARALQDPGRPRSEGGLSQACNFVHKNEYTGHAPSSGSTCFCKVGPCSRCSATCQSGSALLGIIMVHGDGTTTML